MAYTDANLVRIAGNPGSALFRYKTTDLLSVVVASGYFNDAYTNRGLTTGDIILASTGASGAAAVDILVATQSSGTVTVVNGS